nr:GyrI-like domain-containing protein [Bacteroides fragilis]
MVDSTGSRGVRYWISAWFYHEQNKVYGYNYLDRLPTSDYTLREQFTFETYINTPEKTPAAEFITDIYIPITKKET